MPCDSGVSFLCLGYELESPRGFVQHSKCWLGDIVFLSISRNNRTDNNAPGKCQNKARKMNKNNDCAASRSRNHPKIWTLNPNHDDADLRRRFEIA